MSKNETIREYRFSADNANDAQVIIDRLARLGAVSAYKNYGGAGIIEEVNMEDYDKEKLAVKNAILSFASSIAGINCPETSTDMLYAMDNTSFRDIINTITARSIATMMVTYKAPQLERLTEIEDINAGESRTYEIDTKSLPIAQPATYISNVTLVPSYAKSSITLSPKVYTLGISLDYIRVIANGYDWGYAIARVYAGMITAQYKLVVGKIFDTTLLNGTPLYASSFSSSAYTQIASDVAMLNGTTIDDVMAMGTLPALNAISALATTGGYAVRDEYVRTAYLNKIYGVDTMILSQFTNLSAPFTNANASSLRAIPNNLIVFVPTNGDKICKLVRENYIRVVEIPANENTLNRNEYSYFQAFDADIATASYFGLMSTSA